jgi:hypothetical protein
MSSWGKALVTESEVLLFRAATQYITAGSVRTVFAVLTTLVTNHTTFLSVKTVQEQGLSRVIDKCLLIDDNELTSVLC